MHRIRLREPWTASLNADSGAIVYARKFHKPTGVDELPLALRVGLLPQDLDRLETMVTVLVNGRECLAQVPTADQSERALYYQLTDLEAFNSLELRISGANGTTVPIGRQFDATSIPKFGSFVIETVDLLIE